VRPDGPSRDRPGFL